MEFKGVKITERGWAAHFCLAHKWALFCLAHKCMFHCNTLLESKTLSDLKIVVSSVGKIQNAKGELEEIGCGQYYETMVFFAKDDKWQDADVRRGEIAAFAPDYTNVNPWDEIPANNMHDSVVQLFINRIACNEEIKSVYEEYENE